MTTSLRALVFMNMKKLCTNLMEGKAPKNPPLFKCSISDMFYGFGAFQLIACIVIYIFLVETKGVTDKKNLCNPIKQAEKAAAKLAAETYLVPDERVWVDHPYIRKERKMIRLLNNFVNKCFDHFDLKGEKDLISR